MFAIQSGSKFVNAEYFRVTDVYDFTLSARPEVVISRTEANTLFKSVDKFLNGQITWHKNHIAKCEAAITKAQNRAEFLRSKLADLGKKPYKEVGDQVKRVQNEIERCEYAVKDQSQGLKDFRRELNRLEGVQRQGIKMIKFAAVPVK